MDIEVTEERTLLAETTRRFLQAMSPLRTQRAHETDDARLLDRVYWKSGADIGWTSMLLPEELGGGQLSDEPLRDLVVVAEELGRSAAPGPFIPCNVVAAALTRSASDALKIEVLPGIGAGDLTTAWCVNALDPFGEPDLAALATGNGLVINGTAPCVEGALDADWFLVPVQLDGKAAQLLLASRANGVSVRPLRSIDLGRSFAEVVFNEVACDATALFADNDRFTEDVRFQMALTVLLQCADTMGAVQEAFDLTVAYAKDRFSFGRAIGSYQAVKHRLADMKLWIEVGHAATSALAGSIGRGDHDWPEVVCVAKSHVGDMAVDVLQDCIQIHGGIGVTWEHDLHLHLRRVTVNRVLYGASTYYRDRLCTIRGW